MLQSPLVTIGITAFNAANTIERAVSSALKQTWQFTEVIIVDDCSTDETPFVLETLAANFNNISVFYNSINLGVAKTRNRILNMAKGDFVAFFDDDDESVPERIERQVSRILKYEGLVARDTLIVCHTARRALYLDGSEQILPTIGQRENQLAPHGLALARRVILGTPLEDAYGSCPTCSQMARLSTYEAIGGFDPDFRRSEDSDLIVRVAKAGGHVVGVAEPLVIQNMTKTSDKSLADEQYYTLMLLEKHRDIADQEGLYDFCKRWLLLKYIWLERRRIRFAWGLFAIVLNYPAIAFNRLILSLRNLGINRSFSQFHHSAELEDE